MPSKANKLTTIKSSIKKRAHTIRVFFHSKRKTENPQNRIVLLSTFLLLLIGLYFFSIFHTVL